MARPRERLPGHILDLSKVIVRNLIGGQPLVVKCTITNNGYTLHLCLLPDTGANAFAFISPRIIFPFIKLTGAVLRPLPEPVTAKGYDGKSINHITHSVILTLGIDGRRIRMPFLVLDIGHHDIILGRQWFAEVGVKVDCARRTLEYSFPPHLNLGLKEIHLSKNVLLNKSSYTIPAKRTRQEDADRRDQAIRMQEKRSADGIHAINRLESSRTSFLSSRAKTTLYGPYSQPHR